ncbi:Uncharacterized protein dnl_55820 [Desulfonema limicola]|uniref:Uncharacterized protein n=1 Tax=Desulfonema limicola TaxID=45656 RepID=A0A975GJ42_9BACT|nr:Uncharacterized protein dnl_55820 [Desulfonema limicola]
MLQTNTKKDFIIQGKTLLYKQIQIYNLKKLFFIHKIIDMEGEKVY